MPNTGGSAAFRSVSAEINHWCNAISTAKHHLSFLTVYTPVNSNNPRLPDRNSDNTKSRYLYSGYSVKLDVGNCTFRFLSHQWSCASP